MDIDSDYGGVGAEDFYDARDSKRLKVADDAEFPKTPDTNQGDDELFSDIESESSSGSDTDYSSEGYIDCCDSENDYNEIDYDFEEESEALKQRRMKIKTLFHVLQRYVTPKEFLDPIQHTLMKDPVIITSRMTVDSSTVERYIESGFTNVLIRDVELSKRIEEYITSQGLQNLLGVTESKEAEMCSALEFLYTESDKQKWIASWPESASHVQTLIDNTIADGECFTINVGSLDGKHGCFGVLIRDYQGRPIAAYSGYDANSLTVIYNEMQGVNKGLELAIRFKLSYIRMYCRLSDVAYFLGACQRLLHRCLCGDGNPSIEGKQIEGKQIEGKQATAVEKWCEKCVLKSLSPFCPYQEQEKISYLVWEVMDKLLQLEKKSLYIGRSGNYPVDCLETWGTSWEPDPWELRKHPQLPEILYKEASGESGLIEFRIE